MGDARQGLGGHPGPDRHAESRSLGLQLRRYGLVVRILVGRQEHARPGVAHLVQIKVDMRPPDIEKLLHRQPRLFLGEMHPVPVDIMTAVGMVQERNRPAGEGGIAVFLVPLDHGVKAVRIMGGNEQQDHIVQYGPDLFALLGDQAIGQVHRHLRGADFHGMDRAGDADHGAGVAHQPGRLRVIQTAGISELSLHADQLFLPVEVFGRGDDRHPEGALLCGLAETLQLQPGALAVEKAEIGEDGPGIGQAVIIARRESEKALR